MKAQRAGNGTQKAGVRPAIPDSAQTMIERSILQALG
jgi:hypothetical protein